MMLKLTVKDILKQKTFAMIAVISGLILGTVYYFLTLEMTLVHMSSEIELLPLYMTASISLTGIVAVLGGINIALVAYNIKTQKNKNMKNGTSAVLGGALTAFTPGCPACTTSLSAVLGIVGGLAIFPLQGLELKLISIVALTFSIWWAMRNINNTTCCVMK
ncbi:hypothetical protein OAJ83_02435 [Candidatus Nitrosopelagicus sp.]|nr:hypothetical protein [Candidatus Nitrosopelagicus sp.]|tara:strand:- start:300 stop:785 length:486 start_codon:yes stop_codon:yes gene_type:complete